MYRTPEGELFLVITGTEVDGRRLGPNDDWPSDFGLEDQFSGRVIKYAEFHLLTPQEALVWCIRHLIPSTLRGCLLDCVPPNDTARGQVASDGKEES
jgi:hypothetical protein